MTVGALSALRIRVATVLETLDPDWSVHRTAVDSLSPPAFVLGWADPWLEPSTHKNEYARLEVILVAGRLDPDPGIETLELMVERATFALTENGIRPATGPPGPFEIGGVRYLAAHMTLAYPVTFTATPEVP